MANLKVSVSNIMLHDAITPDLRPKNLVRQINHRTLTHGPSYMENGLLLQKM